MANLAPNLMRFFLFTYTFGIFLLSCQSSSQFLTREQQDSVEVTTIQDFKKKNSAKFELFNKSIAKALDFVHSPTIQALDSNEKITLNIPYCSFADSCKYKASELTVMLPSYRLRGEDLKFYTYFTPHYFLSALNTLSALEKNTYRATRFQDSSWEYVKKNLHKDLHNVQVLWQCQWLIILDLAEMQAPTSEFGGGKIVGLWHLFDFTTTEYKGTISVMAENTPNFRPPTTRQKEVIEEKNTRRYHSKNYSTTERTIVRRQETEYLNDAQRYYYASKNLEENFKNKSLKEFSKYFKNAKGSDVFW